MTLGDLLLSIEGRIGRKGFWLGVAILFAARCVSALLDGALFGSAQSLFSGLLGIAAIWPGIALSAKRWHDRDKSAWWILIQLLPIIGWIWSFVENGFLRGTPGPNRFGPDPLSQTA